MLVGGGAVKRALPQEPEDTVRDYVAARDGLSVGQRAGLRVVLYETHAHRSGGGWGGWVHGHPYSTQHAADRGELFDKLFAYVTRLAKEETDDKSLVHVRPALRA